ncbi:HPr kinase/phosphatase C-terminal domain-containing protein [Sphingomonas sp. 1P06PA]|uniref:HPr kinase/phosphorylase n=1 Tax=Sphingomonas sp. 1P06PA TaxID=554121 RepID=UPI0039A75ECB
MTMRPLSSETIHASCVALSIAGTRHAVLLGGRSGAGKSDLALRLIDRGAVLVSDDYTLLRRTDAGLIASAPATIVGRMEVRGIGIVTMETLAECRVRLLVALDEPVDRMPEGSTSRIIAGIPVPTIRLPSLEPSAAIKIELALREIGLKAP